MIRPYLYLYLVVMIIMKISSCFSDENNWKQKQIMIDLLFPNRSRTILDKSVLSKSRLLKTTSSTTTIPCVICRGLSYCQALNNLMIEEVYYPDNLNLLGTCYVLEALGERLSNEVFGNGKSFRDTVECREMVLEYLCLFYGSNNEMYVNNCIYQEDVSDPNPANHKVAPRYPCRSFCVQVATTCAIDITFVNLCEDIACPPTQDQCTPDPTIDGTTLAANLGCDFPYNTNPYVRKSCSNSLMHSIHNISVVLIVFIVLCITFFILE